MNLGDFLSLLSVIFCPSHRFTMAPPNDDNTALETVPKNITGETTGEKTATAVVKELSPTEMIYYTYDGCFELAW